MKYIQLIKRFKKYYVEGNKYYRKKHYPYILVEQSSFKLVNPSRKNPHSKSSNCAKGSWKGRKSISLTQRSVRYKTIATLGEFVGKETSGGK